MDTQQEETTVNDPGFETEMRSKAKDVLSTLQKLEVTASPLTFTIRDVTISMSLMSGSNVSLAIGDLYTLVMPLRWITG